MVTVNVVVLAGTVAADPVERTMPSGDEVTELRLSVPEAGKRLLPLPVAVWHKDVGKRVLKPIAKGDDVLVYGQLVRRFYRSGGRGSEPHGGRGGWHQEAGGGAGRLRHYGQPASRSRGRNTRPVRGLGQKNVDFWGRRSPRSITSRIRDASVGGSR
jgi:single-strand DNA-binding protein